MIELLTLTIWLLLPSYTPNNFAVIFGGGTPIDMGKKFRDGRRILGDGKTFRGFLFGVLGGVFTGIIQYGVENIFGFSIFSTLPLPSFLILSSLLSFGALTGDIFGSFVKRRVGFERGRSFPVLDQLGFLVFAFLFASIHPAFGTLYTPDVILTGIIITPILHVVTNIIAYKLGLKEVPW
jgi:CDP-2,3-bis-(O-geranylgeranyl)-sn-glycerol synthase